VKAATELANVSGTELTDGWVRPETSIEDIAVLGALLVFSSLSLAVIVLIY
jgi:hypothetical protein